jgi:hypothetical protein
MTMDAVRLTGVNSRDAATSKGVVPGRSHLKVVDLDTCSVDANAWWTVDGVTKMVELRHVHPMDTLPGVLVGTYETTLFAIPERTVAVAIKASGIQQTTVWPTFDLECPSDFIGDTGYAHADS